MTKSNVLISDPEVTAVLEKNTNQMEAIELFEENNLYKIVKKADLNEIRLGDKTSNDASDPQSGLKTSPSICITIESNNSNELRTIKQRSNPSKMFSRINVKKVFLA